MLPPGSKLTGLQCWRKLRRLEGIASELAVAKCNRDVPEAEEEEVKERVRHGIRRIFGRDLPGFFINMDPRGYALKLESKSVPYPLHQDWGEYQILAPVIE